MLTSPTRPRRHRAAVGPTREMAACVPSRPSTTRMVRRRGARRLTARAAGAGQRPPPVASSRQRHAHAPHRPARSCRAQPPPVGAPPSKAPRGASLPNARESATRALDGAQHLQGAPSPRSTARQNRRRRRSVPRGVNRAACAHSHRTSLPHLSAPRVFRRVSARCVLSFRCPPLIPSI
jgi:hypothetical protein